MHNETLRPEATPAGMDGYSPTVDGAQRSHAPGTLVDKYGLRGIAIWALGNEGSRAWPRLKEYGRALATG